MMIINILHKCNALGFYNHYYLSMQEEDKIILQKFAKILKDKRQKKYSSLNQFAFDSVNLTSATVSRIENANVDFKFTTLIKLAYALGISVSDLLKDFKYDFNDFE